MRKAVFALPLVLAACQQGEPVAICATAGDPAEYLTLAMQAADGTQVRYSSSIQASTATTHHRRLDPPLLPQLWRQFETTIRATQENDVSGCEGATILTAVIFYENGAREIRRTNCEGNAVARLVTTVLDTSGLSHPGSEEVQATSEPPFMEPLAACEALR